MERQQRKLRSGTRVGEIRSEWEMRNDKIKKEGGNDDDNEY